RRTGDDLDAREIAERDVREIDGTTGVADDALSVFEDEDAIAIEALDLDRGNAAEKSVGRGIHLNAGLRLQCFGDVRRAATFRFLTCHHVDLHRRPLRFFGRARAGDDDLFGFVLGARHDREEKEQRDRPQAHTALYHERPMATCPACQRELDDDFALCPYDGTSLTGGTNAAAPGSQSPERAALNALSDRYDIGEMIGR